LKADEINAQDTELRQSKYLNDIIKREHRSIKRIMKPMMELKTFNPARSTLSKTEAMNKLRKGQVQRIDPGSSVSEAKVIEAIFGIAAECDTNGTNLR
jgi:transposase-like protein